MQAHEYTAISTAIQLPKLWERFVDNVYSILQGSIINKIFTRITNNYSLPQSQKQTQTTDIKEEETRMSVNLRYIEGTIEKLRRMLRSQKIRSTFYTESTLRKPLRKSKDRVATNIVYENNCSKCETVSFCESKRSLKSLKSNQINKISYMFPEIWLPNLR